MQIFCFKFKQRVKLKIRYAQQKVPIFTYFTNIIFIVKTDHVCITLLPLCGKHCGMNPPPLLAPVSIVIFWTQAVEGVIQQRREFKST
jgi:hypothetical protein